MPSGRQGRPLQCPNRSLEWPSLAERLGLPQSAADDWSDDWRNCSLSTVRISWGSADRHWWEKERIQMGIKSASAWGFAGRTKVALSLLDHTSNAMGRRL